MSRRIYYGSVKNFTAKPNLRSQQSPGAEGTRPGRAGKRGKLDIPNATTGKNRSPLLPADYPVVYLRSLYLYIFRCLPVAGEITHVSHAQGLSRCRGAFRKKLGSEWRDSREETPEGAVVGTRVPANLEDGERPGSGAVHGGGKEGVRGAQDRRQGRQGEEAQKLLGCNKTGELYIALDLNSLCCGGMYCGCFKLCSCIG